MQSGLYVEASANKKLVANTCTKVGAAKILLYSGALLLNFEGMKL